MKMKRRNTLGFTLIELVVVIAILGILAALAIPRFVDLQVEARQAAVDGLAGSIRSAAVLAHSQWVAEGQPSSIDMEGNTITITNGYPAADNIDDALVDFTGFTFSSGTFTKDGASTPANCSVAYTAASSGATPTVTVTTTGC